MAAGGQGGNADADMVSKSQERIYSAQQLVQALKSSAAAVKEQLQVLAILDGTAGQWPGVNQAMDDLEFLIDMTSQTTHRLEKNVKKSDTKSEACESEVATLKETLSTSNKKCEDLQAECGRTTQENRQLATKLDAATKETTQQKQQLWTLQKQQEDLSNEVDKYKQDNELQEGEISSLRGKLQEQMQQLTSLKEELSARNADVQHLGRSVAEHKAQTGELRKQLESTSGTLSAIQNQLQHVQSEKHHYEKENDRHAEEASRLTAELNKVSTEAQRQREWAVVLKKVEADKLRDEQQAHAKSLVEFQKATSELEKVIVQLKTELANREQGLVMKTAEASNLMKQNGLLSIQQRDLQKQLAVMQADRSAMMKEQEAAKAEMAKLHSRLQAGVVQVAQLDKDRAVSEGKVKEQAVAEKARLEAAYREACKEAAVQKTLSEGWSRDLKETNARLRAEQDKCNGLKEQLDAVMRSKDGDNHGKHLELVRQLATMEQVVRDLRGQLSLKDTELRRVRAESASTQKLLEKQIERLQRECDEGATEVSRLRKGDGVRLPFLSARPPPQSLQDELDCLKKFVSERSMVVMPASAGRSGPGSLPPTRPPTHSNYTDAPAPAAKHVTIMRRPTR